MVGIVNDLGYRIGIFSSFHCIRRLVCLELGLIVWKRRFVRLLGFYVILLLLVGVRGK